VTSLPAKIALALWLLFTAWQLWSLIAIQAHACAYAYAAQRYATGSREIAVRPCP